MTPLVLGYVEDYGRDDLYPFVDSLRQTGYTGDVTLFVRNVAPDALRLLETYDVDVRRVSRFDSKPTYSLPAWLVRWFNLSVDTFHPDLSVNRRLASMLDTLGLHTSAVGQAIARVMWHCNVARFFYYARYLEAHRDYDVVLLTDIRDVIFQDHPFLNVSADRLLLFEEHPRTPLRHQVDNARWINALYGADRLDAIGEAPIICAGVMLGGADPLLAMIRAMNVEMVGTYIGWGTDQGVLNHLARMPHDDVRIHPFGTGPAMHLGIAPRRAVSTDAYGRVLDANGAVCPIIHQYDRHPDLIAQWRGDAEEVLV